MGNLLSGLFGKSGPELDLQLEGAEPPASGTQREAFDSMQKLLVRSAEAARLIEEYTGCKDLAKEAWANPTPENEQRALEGLLPAVDAIDYMYQFTKDLTSLFPMFISEIANTYNPQLSLQENVPQALCAQLVQLLSFAISFDQVRMRRPNLCNDFAFYRRLLPKFQKHPDIRITDEEATDINTFTAQHTPILNALNKSSKNAGEDNPNVGISLALLGNSCLKGIKEGRFSGEVLMQATRAMAAAVVLYDHTDFPHAFHKKAPIRTKEIILELKKIVPTQQDEAVALLNAIHFSTAHFNEAPGSIANLFD